MHRIDLQIIWWRHRPCKSEVPAPWIVGTGQDPFRRKRFSSSHHTEIIELSYF